MAPSLWQLLIVLAIVVLLFGTKRLRNIGSDLGSAIRGFRSSIKDDDSSAEPKPADGLPASQMSVTAQPQVTVQPAAQPAVQPAAQTVDATKAATQDKI
jgi:sec-independent protein translocase protein TatA